MKNKLGDGVAIFLTHEKYPENSVVYPVYKNLVKMLLSHSYNNAKIKVTGSDKVGFRSSTRRMVKKHSTFLTPPTMPRVRLPLYETAAQRSSPSLLPSCAH